MGDGCAGAALVDLSEDLLEEVLIGDDAGEAAVHIDYRQQLVVQRSHFCDTCLLSGERPTRRRLAYDHLELLYASRRRQLAAWLHTQAPDDCISQLVEQLNQRSEEPGKGAKRTNHQQPGPQRPCNRDALGDL